MLTEGPQEDVIPPVQQQHEMPAQNEPVHDNTAGGDQGICARALYDYQAGECRGSECLSFYCLWRYLLLSFYCLWAYLLSSFYCCVNTFVILLSVGIPYLLLCKHVCHFIVCGFTYCNCCVNICLSFYCLCLLLCKHVSHFIVCGFTYCCVNMFVILLSVGIPVVV